MSASAAKALLAGAVSALTVGLMPDAQAAEQVDVELVLAVDVSLSMSPDELEIQRRGYATALTDDAVLRAIADGVHGKIDHIQNAVLQRPIHDGKTGRRSTTLTGTSVI